MVEKIDRPDAPPAYRITEAKKTDEDQHQQQDQRDDAEKKYQKQLDGKDWTKYGRRTTVIKPVRVPRERIAKCIFRSVSLYKGIGILQVKVIWKDGRTTEIALIRVPHLEDFTRLKKLSPGNEVPVEFWGSGPQVELGIPQSISSSGPIHFDQIKRQEKESPVKRESGVDRLLIALGIINRGTGGISWGMVAFYLFLVAIIVIAIVTQT